MPRVYESPVEQVGELKIKRFLELITAGLFRAEACRAAQLDQSKVDKWLHKGDKGVELYVSFARQVREAEAGVVADELKKIRADTDFRAHTWFLERRFPNQWGTRGEGDTERTAGEVEDMRETLRERMGAIIGSAAGDS